jgi:hypothetical protein
MCSKAISFQCVWAPSCAISNNATRGAARFDEDRRRRKVTHSEDESVLSRVPVQCIHHPLWHERPVAARLLVMNNVVPVKVCRAQLRQASVPRVQRGTGYPLAKKTRPE